MKKLYYAASLLAVVSLSVLTGCKKDTVAFPTNPQSNGTYPDLAYTTPWFPTISDADGIFISAQVTDEKTVIISPFVNSYEYGMAKVAGSTGNFSSLVDVGTVTLNDSVLVKGSDFSYLSSISNFTLNLGNGAVWNIGGNAFTATNTNPTYTYSPTLWDSKWAPVYPRTLYPLPVRPTITHLDSTSTPADSAYYNANKSTITTYLSDSTTHVNDSIYNRTVQYEIPIKNYTANADSVFIYMTDDKGFVYKRTALPTDSLATFKPNDFLGYSSYDLTTFKLQVNAINYQNAIINSKKYYFLKMASAIKYYQATK
ncbi:MAG TPA: hypothetical protein VKG26_16505 [Bacteroidia bacterium]|nr:hypothetical protein [Bacteroidia bacterium]